MLSGREARGVSRVLWVRLGYSSHSNTRQWFGKCIATDIQSDAVGVGALSSINKCTLSTFVLSLRSSDLRGPRGERCLRSAAGCTRQLPALQHLGAIWEKDTA